MKLDWTEIEGLRFFLTHKFNDERGFLNVLHDSGSKTDDLSASSCFQRLLLVESKRGTIRGIHRARRDFPEHKFVACISGRVREVLVDLRLDSPTFGAHTELILDSSESYALCIPHGVGQAYEVISNTALLIYALNTEYAPERELTINAFDPVIGIDWGTGFIQSKRDKDAPGLEQIKLMNLL